MTDEAEICVVSDARFDSDGELTWDPRQNFPEGHWNELLHVFGSVAVAARTRSASREERIGPLIPQGVRVLAFPYFVGLRRAFRKLPSVIAAARRTARAADTFVLRGPGLLSMLVWPWIRLRRRPYAVEVLGDLEEVFTVTDRPFAAPARQLARRAVGRICHSASSALYVSQALSRKYPASARAFTTVVSDAKMPAEAFREPREWLEAPKRLSVVHVGNMELVYKGHETMIRAVALCRERGLDLQLRFIGDGRMRPSFERLARELGVDDAIVFEGALPWGAAVFEHLDRADLFILPSLTEAMPKALIEAMARGLPAIASRVGGIPELLDDEMMIPPGDAQALADTIHRVARDPALLTSMARRSFETALRFQDEVLSPLRREFYERVRDCARRGRHAR